MLFRASEAMSKYISGVILYDETIRQKAKDGTPLTQVSADAGSIPGIKGDKGEAGGLPNAFEARNANPVEITGTTSETATTVLASGTLTAGKYAFNAQIYLQGGVDTIIFCQARGPGSAGPLLGVPATLHVGSGVGAVGQGTIPLAFAATFAAPGSIYVGCWVDSPNQPRPTAESSDLVALTIGDLSGP